MAKKVALTDRIQAALTQRGVTEFDNIAVFECVAASTRPISQKWSIFNGARMTPSMLKDMASYLTSESVPLMQMHDTYALPTGQLLLADTFEQEFDTELNTLFYLEANSDLANKIELGIIDEVSIGAESKHARCSSCGFDFFASDRNKEMLLWERTCENDHTLGQDNVHLILDGVLKWSETSLVSKGASSRPKILPIDQQRLATDESYKRLAASGVNPDLLTVRASTVQPTTQPDQEPTNMDAKEILAQLTQTSTELGAANTNVAALTTNLAASATKITELETQLAAAATAPSDREAELQTQLTASEASLVDVKSSKDLAVNFISEHYTKACALLGQEAKADAPLQDMLDTVNDARLALHQIPVGGAGHGAEEETPVAVQFASTAFCSKR